MVAPKASLCYVRDTLPALFQIKFSSTCFIYLRFILQLNTRFTGTIPDQSFFNSVTKQYRPLMKSVASLPRTAVTCSLCMCLCSTEDPLQLGVQSAARSSRRLQAS
jgi:hypothetical protein